MGLTFEESIKRTEVKKNESLLFKKLLNSVVLDESMPKDQISMINDRLLADFFRRMELYNDVLIRQIQDQFRQEQLLSQNYYESFPARSIPMPRLRPLNSDSNYIPVTISNSTVTYTNNTKGE